jgi:uncharacterized protein
LALSIYLDASVLVALFTEDLFSMRAAALHAPDQALIVSDFAAAELSAVIARNVRMAQLKASTARAVLSDFDVWRERAPLLIEIDPKDVRTADTFVRRLDLNLRAPDAIHIAIAQRLGAELATFDARMAECARALGAKVLPI